MSLRLCLVSLIVCVGVGVGARDIAEPLSALEWLRPARDAIAAGQWQAAIKALEAAVAQNPGSADAHNLLAFSYRKQETPDLPKAFEHYRKALALDPTHRSAHEYIGEAYLADRKLAQAEEHLRTLERLCGNRDCEEYQDLARAIARYREVGR